MKMVRLISKKLIALLFILPITFERLCSQMDNSCSKQLINEVVVSALKKNAYIEPSYCARAMARRTIPFLEDAISGLVASDSIDFCAKDSFRMILYERWNSPDAIGYLFTPDSFVWRFSLIDSSVLYSHNNYIKSSFVLEKSLFEENEKELIAMECIIKEGFQNKGNNFRIIVIMACRKEEKWIINVYFAIR